MLESFIRTKPVIKKGDIKSIKDAKLVFVKKYIITIENNTYLMIKEYKYVLINGVNKN